MSTVVPFERQALAGRPCVFCGQSLASGGVAGGHYHENYDHIVSCAVKHIIPEQGIE